MVGADRPRVGKGWSRGKKFVPREICAQCGVEFYAPPVLKRRGGGIYCSKACRGLAMRKENNGKTEAIECPQCGVTFYCYPSQLLKARAKFCSKTCADGARRAPPKPPKPKREHAWNWNPDRPIAICMQCGVQYEPGRGTRAKFCSRACAGGWRSGHAEPFGSRVGSGGKRDDLGGLYVRSRWEANWARYLNFLRQQGEIVDWEYEAQTFEFQRVRKGTRFYTPDFRVRMNDGGIVFHEVKGWMDPKSKTKLDRMRRYYPEVTIELVDKERYYPVARQLRGLLPHWESGGDHW